MKCMRTAMPEGSACKFKFTADAGCQQGGWIPSSLG